MLQPTGGMSERAEGGQRESASLYPYTGVSVRTDHTTAFLSRATIAMMKRFPQSTGHFRTAFFTCFPH
jgi:hypothetical protein